ncbi:HEPN domain-containing protein [Alkalinema pantanalense CENA528]|uniref:ApeA N-terminal domain 1-containing protein n=1 Tax=Alkalinema pantanalense TaxID=1620705 RepID=UPI003D6EE6DB
MTQEYEGFKKAGIFSFTNEIELQGELCLKGAATTLVVYSSSSFDWHMNLDWYTNVDIFGIFFDRSKVSLINCVTMSSSSATRDNELYNFSTIFPHFAIFGDQHISSSCQIIRELSFTVNDAAALFHDFDAFGLVIDAKPYIEDIVETRAKQRGGKIEIGEYPQIFYFTGKYEIFSIDTALGKISATHCPSYQSPSPKGIYVANSIKINIAFYSCKSIDEAITSVLDVLKFLEIIAGRPQNISDLVFLPVSTQDHLKPLKVYWCMPPQYEHDGISREPHPFDLPLQAAINSDEFGNVLKRWMERHNEWRDARARFSTAFAYQNSYNIDRIIGAANMFDILPACAYPESVTLLPDLAEARDNARKAFRALPPSPERDSILGALGRIGKASLKRKVRSRAKLITDVASERFPDLELVVDQAIDCRNYYVHGSNTKIDYSMHSAQVQFFTNTLEFIFAASDLVESGWDITTWIKRGSTMSHPFARYCFNYSQMLSALKKLLE